MSVTADMLDPERRVAEVSAFADWQAQHGASLTTDQYLHLSSGARDPLYGHIVGVALHELPSITPKENHNLVLPAVEVLSSLTLSSSRDYFANKERFRPRYFAAGKDFRAMLHQLHRDLTNGVIHPVPERYGMTRQEGRSQIIRANTTFNNNPHLIQTMLAGLNYSNWFKPNETMADGGALLETTLDDAIDGINQRGMQHLNLTNFAHGEIVRGLARQGNGQLSIIDIGSGMGSTLAGILGGLEQAGARGADLDRVHITSIESNPDFAKILAKFATRAALQYPAFPVTEGLDITTAAREGRLSLFIDDVLSALNKLEALPNGADDLSLVIANFVCHRFPSRVKAQIISTIAQWAPNSAFLVADLRDNSSAINRNYFNLGPNGPNNPGNLGLEEIFRSYGYTVIKIAEDTPTFGMDPYLKAKIAQGAADDGHYWIAYRGEEAARRFEELAA